MKRNDSDWSLKLGVGLIAAGLLARRHLGFSFRNKVVLVTGGSRGLGLVVARRLARAGAHLAICARDKEELSRARQELVALGAQVLAIPCDVMEKEQVDRMMHTIRGHYGQIDVLINNAGAIQVGPMEAMTIEDFETAMKTHFWAPLYTSLAVLPDFRARRSGRIVNISSIGGKIPVPHLLPYVASKFALTGFSEGLATEMARYGVSVTTAIPGLMRTGSPYQAKFKGKHRAEYQWFSISDSLPIVSVSAERAADRILAACARGQREVTISLPAQFAVKFHGMFPGLTNRVLGQVNRLLPEMGGVMGKNVKGIDSTTPLSESWVTGLTQRAAKKNNELQPQCQYP